MIGVHALLNVHKVIVEELVAAVYVVLLLSLASWLDDPAFIISEWIRLAFILSKHPKNKIIRIRMKQQGHFQEKEPVPKCAKTSSSLSDDFELSRKLGSYLL